MAADQGTPARAAIFFDRLAEACRRHESLLCVGLDPPLEGIPDTRLVAHNRKIIDATADLACCFKPNIAFYEARGIPGMKALAETVNLVRAKGLPVILDAKRGDIASTAAAYAKAVFERWNADAVTLSPFLGRDSVEPFTAYADRGVFLLCHTSNPGARDLQELETGGMPLYQLIAALAGTWNRSGNVGLVVSATYPEEVARVRRAVNDLWFLLPGVGAQGGDLAACLEAGLRPDGLGLVVNVSRAIYQAADPRAAALDFRDRINAIRRARGAVQHAAPGSSPSSIAAAAADQSLVDSIAVGLHALGAVRFGEFTLKSGQKSPIYLDLRLLVSDPVLMRIVARAMAGLLARLSYERIAAIPYGGLPIGQAVALETGRPMIYPRREMKDYGTKKAIEGAFTPGETVVVLDDLVTTGGSKLEAIAPLAEAGLVVKDIVVLVDRGQGGAEELSAHGYTLHAVLTLGRLLDALVRRGTLPASTADGVRSTLGIA